MTKNELKKTRNGDDASLRLEFAIMERVKEHSFLPKTAGSCQPFAQRRAAHASRVIAMTSSPPRTFCCVPENRMDARPLSSFLRDAAATDAKQRQGFQTSTRDACLTQSVAAARPWRRTWARPRRRMGSRSGRWSGGCCRSRSRRGSWGRCWSASRGGGWC